MRMLPVSGLIVQQKRVLGIMGLFGRKTKEDKPAVDASVKAAVPDTGSLSEHAKDVKTQDAQPKADENENHEKSVVSAHDLEKKDKDRSLYRSLLAGLYDAVLILDEKGMIIGTNPRVTTLFGYPEDDLWHTPCSQLLPSMKPAVLQKIREHADSGRFSVVNASCTRQDGTSFPAEIAMSKIDLLNKDDLLLSVRNIERRVLGQNRKSRDVVITDALATAVVSCRADGLVLSVNPAFLRLAGLENQQDVVHRFIGDFCESNEMGVQLLLKQQGSSAHWVGEMQFVREGGRKVHVVASAARFQHEDAEQLAITFTPIPRRAALVRSEASG